MAGVTKVNGTTEEGQFFGREIMILSVPGMAAAPAAVDGVITWPELNAAIQAIETICTVSAVGAFVATDTEVQVIIEGHDYNDIAGELVRINAATGLTCVQVPL